MTLDARKLDTALTKADALVEGTRSRVDDEPRLSKVSVDYSPGKGETRCRHCAHYEGHGTCRLVMGYIDPDYWCKKFRKG